MRVLILGFDAFDPATFESLSEEGRLPNLTRWMEQGNYARFAVSNPPQTEVSWTSIATGADPGEHAIFDFVHRDPRTYTPYLSLLPTKRGPFGTQFVPPYKARTIFEEATRQGFPATSLWWPATFPARPELPVRMLPGLGTPDIQGRWGVGTLLTSAPEPEDDERKTAVVQLERHGNGRYTGFLSGPVRKKAKGSQQSAIELHLDLADNGSARLRIGQHALELAEGKWSPIVGLSFKMGLFFKVHATTRFILTQADPEIKLYALPLQIHPLHSPWRYATPPSFVKEMWKTFGPFLTLGWPQDTTALEEGCVTDSQFLTLCASIFGAREQILLHQLSHFSEGILASVFDSLDRIQHMFRRDRPDIVAEWYTKMDALVGKVEQRLADQGGPPKKIVIVSDHGFSEFDYKVHLNRWLIQHGYLSTREENGRPGSLRDVDWSQSQAYAVGLNSLYLNLVGREGQGSVQVQERLPLIDRIGDELLNWQGPDGRPVIHSVSSGEEAFHGPFVDHGPDLVLGFSPGYRSSAETGLGQWKEMVIEPNRDHWGADHCVYPEAVPGVLFCNEGLVDFPHPSYREFPALVLGADLQPGASAPPPSFSEEDEEVIEERLRGLGYL
jgi:predicted AlkP superfamily phosphohydrolase/phosphomutase